MSVDPYRPPSSDLEGGRSDSLAEAVHSRKTHLRHESAVRSIGWLYSLTLALMLVIFFFGMNQRDGWDAGNVMVVALSLMLLSVCLLWMGYGLRALQRRARLVAVVLALAGLPLFPLGTLVGGHVLSLLFSDKGRQIFSDEYKRIIEATPHLMCQTPSIIRLLFVLLLFSIGIVFF